MKARTLLLPAAVLALALTACGTEDDDDDTTAGGQGTASTPAADACAPENLETVSDGVLTIATDEPVFEPWFVDNDPTNGQGFEGAVAYAVAEELGFARDQVTWERVGFNAALQPGPKNFDFDINEFSITEERKQSVDFSSPYYDVTQAVIALNDSPAAAATTLAELMEVTLGAQVGTTSLSAIEEIIQPNPQPGVFNSNDEARLALENGQIDALVVDLPTAFFMTAAQLENASIVGQLPQPSGSPEQFGLVLDKGSSLTECVSAAVDALRADGTLAALEQQWLAEVADAPVLQ